MSEAFVINRGLHPLYMTVTVRLVVMSCQPKASALVK